MNTRLDRQEADIFAKETASTERYYKDAELAKAGLRDIAGCSAQADGDQDFPGWASMATLSLQRRQQAVVDEREAASRDNRSMDYAIIASGDRYAKYIERLEGKRQALQQVILSAYQTSVTVRMMGDNENHHPPEAERYPHRSAAAVAYADRYRLPGLPAARHRPVRPTAHSQRSRAAPPGCRPARTDGRRRSRSYDTPGLRLRGHALQQRQAGEIAGHPENCLDRGQEESGIAQKRKCKRLSASWATRSPRHRCARNS